jgi:succinate dehydrogenase / fumarate reductase cytochrome b subunit
VRPEITSPGYSDVDVYSNVVRGFSNPLITAFYVVAMGALALHLFHGAWSSFRTLGINRPKPRPTARSVATLVAAIVTLGFVVVPLGVAFGIIKPQGARPSPAVEQAGAQPGASTTASVQGK